MVETVNASTYHFGVLVRILVRLSECFNIIGVDSLLREVRARSVYPLALHGVDRCLFVFLHDLAEFYLMKQVLLALEIIVAPKHARFRLKYKSEDELLLFGCIQI